LLEQAVENGAWGILHKPLEMNKMLEMIEKLGRDGILIADDDPDFVESIRDLLLSRGWNVLIARDGRKAVECIRSNSIDILILDLRLPVLSGIETYLELKRTGHSVPTIIVTAFADDEEENIRRLESMSVSGILRKPFNPSQLLDEIDQLVNQKNGHN
jgi:DNA-binding response OmpR family regulator